METDVVLCSWIIVGRLFFGPWMNRTWMGRSRSVELGAGT